MQINEEQHDAPLSAALAPEQKQQRLQSMIYKNFVFSFICFYALLSIAVASSAAVPLVLRTEDGTYETFPVQFRSRIMTSDQQDFKETCRSCSVCMEIDHQIVRCQPLWTTHLVFESLSIGNHSMRMHVVDETTNKRITSTEPTAFEVMDVIEYQARLQAHQIWMHPKELHVTEWYAEHQMNPNHPKAENTTTTDDQPREKLLIIGVKTSIEDGFPYRQAIRETWASTLPTESVQLVFLGCQPPLESDPTLLDAIEFEKRMYQDLLTHELDCVDGYAHLVHKVTQFLSFAINGTTRFEYVMITDDDVYVRIEDLVDALATRAPKERLYAGQVWSTQFHHPIRPVRNPSVTKYFVSHEAYPLPEFPPFANGPHYLLSMDCASFIGRNKHELSPLTSSLDDVSIAIWLLAMQVHAKHIPRFQNLRDSDCNDALISFADLSTTGIRDIHSNVIHNRSFCHEFARSRWLKPKLLLMPFDLYDDPSTDPFLALDRVALHLQPQQTRIEAMLVHQEREFRVEYIPSHETFGSFCERVYQTWQSEAPDDTMLLRLHASLQSQMHRAWELIENEQVDASARLALWQHNVQVSSLIASPPNVKIVVFTKTAGFSRVVLECLFASIFSTDQVLVVEEETFAQQAHVIDPDVFVFSILDGDCGYEHSNSQSCRSVNPTYLERYGASKHTTLVMLSGEAWSIEPLEASFSNVLLLSTVQTTVPGYTHVYLPVASSSFGERRYASPMQLLAPRSNATIASISSRKFCAYMYARCDRPQREYMYELLNAIEPVDALGACKGSSKPQAPQLLTNRIDPWYNDEAVTTFSDYKFVIAFENTQLEGYVTEKLINPMLAHAIPIYLGHSSSVAKIFNPASFIDCGTFRHLKDCAAFVHRVHSTPAFYQQMLREPIVSNETAFLEAFSWHPDVSSSFVPDQVAQHLQQHRHPMEFHIPVL